MINSSTDTTTCQQVDAFDEAMKLVGDFWTLRIVEALSESELRFCEIERTIPEISPATLTARLKRLEEKQVIARKVETRDRQSVSYTLSDRGRGVVPVLDAIKLFTSSYFS